jgi:hypothetical protein
VVFRESVFYAETFATKLAFEWEVYLLTAEHALHQFLGSPPEGIAQFIKIEKLIEFFLRLVRIKFATAGRCVTLIMKKDKCPRRVTTFVARSQADCGVKSG